jgi:REP element-mobilizing transposase RayT
VLKGTNIQFPNYDALPGTPNGAAPRTEIDDPTPRGETHMAQTLVSLLVHVVFSTKNREPFITPDIEDDLYAYISGIIRNHQSRCLAINGTADHVHMLVSQSKNIALSDLLEDIKKDSSTWIKTKDAKFKSFYWQVGYAGFSIGQSSVGALTRYIGNQKQHHRKRNFQEELLDLLKKYEVEYDERYIWT